MYDNLSENLLFIELCDVTICWQNEISAENIAAALL